MDRSSCIPAVHIISFCVSFLSRVDELNKLAGSQCMASSRRRTSSRRRSSLSTSRRRSTSRGRSSSSGGSVVLKITKYTPIKPTTFRSPVIRSQAKIGSRAKLFTGAVAGYLVFRYALGDAPVYRGGFLVYGSYVSIPENRAVRVSFEEERLLVEFCAWEARKRNAP